MLDPAIEEKQVLESFQSALNQPRFSSDYVQQWMNRVRFDGLSEDRHIILAVPTLFHRDFIEEHFIKDLLALMESDLRSELSVVWSIDESLGKAGKGEGEIYEEPREVRQAVACAEPAPPSLPSPGNYQAVPFNEIFNKLDPRFRFDNFVTAPSNQLAFAGAQAIAETPESAFNPLFIYGDTGLGKTHLLNAIGHRFLQVHPKARVIYMSSEELTNDYIGSLTTNRMPQFRKRMREECDCLLIDDIQFLGPRAQTQEEFFHIFNALYNRGKPVVMTSDRIPAEIPGIADRLRMRFSSGLTADIQEPDFETRVAILKKKADAFNIQLPDDVAYYIASVIQSNVRELQMALNRVYAHHSLTRQPMTEELAAHILKNVLPAAKTLGVEDVQKEISKYYNVTVESLSSPKRQRHLVKARQMAMYICRKLTGISYPELGARFHRDHSTVISSCEKIENELNEDLSLRRELEELMSRLTKTSF